MNYHFTAPQLLPDTAYYYLLLPSYYEIVQGMGAGLVRRVVVGFQR